MSFLSRIAGLFSFSETHIFSPSHIISLVYSGPQNVDSLKCDWTLPAGPECSTIKIHSPTPLKCGHLVNLELGYSVACQLALHNTIATPVMQTIIIIQVDSRCKFLPTANCLLLVGLKSIQMVIAGFRGAVKDDSLHYSI